MPAPRQVLVVLGMHRGGTSALAGMLHRLGVNFGPRLMPANADNPAGYYEHNDVVNLHDRFLGRLGAAWDDPFPPEFDPGTWPNLAPAQGLPTYRDELLATMRRDFTNGDVPPSTVSAPWGLKDPRLCLLLPWWAPLWEALDVQPLFLLVLRSPEAVAASLGRRDGFTPARSNLLWLQHLLRAERDTRGGRRCFVDYDDFLEDWRGSLERVGRELDLRWPRPPASLSSAEAGFLDPALRHHHPAGPPNPDAAWGVPFSWVQTVRSELLQAGSGSSQTLDDIHGELFRMGAVFRGLGDVREGGFETRMEAQRRLTRWYEEEWQKAVAEVKTLNQRLWKREQKILSLQARPDVIKPDRQR